MRQWASTSAKSLLLAAGFVALGSGVAFADTGAATSGNGSLLGGNQAVVNGDVPVNLSGNAVGAVGGIAGANATDTSAEVEDHGDHDIHSSGNGSVLGGNQLGVDADVPVNATGNAVGAVGGIAGANAPDTSAEVEDHGHHDTHSSGNGSVLGGNQLGVDADVPVNATGNAVGALGGVAGANATDTEAEVEHQSAPSDVSATDVLGEAAENAQLLPAADTSGVDAGVLQQAAPIKHDDDSIATSGNGSLLGGNQAVVDGDVPVNLSGNAISALGVSGANATDTEAEVEEQHQDVRASGNGSLLGGNQAVVDGDVPVTLSGNASSALGVSGANATDTEAEVEGQHQDVRSSGNGSVLGGNQLVGDLDVPVNATGNGIGVLGVAGANATDTEAEVEGQHQDVRSSGNGSVLGGNQLVGDLDVPVNAAGNGIGVLGVAGANAPDTEAEVEHQSATEEQSALEGLPVVDQLPEVPVSEQLPVDYDLQETQEPAAEEAPAEEAPLEEAPAEEAPVEEAPVEEAPAEEAPVEEAPVEEAPLEEAPEALEGAELPEAPMGDQGNPVDALLGAAGLGL
ncbi:hypothetical protein IDM40_03980 [Nocardiopsis sp. HNM0947]|uniref:Chaplin domain-containing protein n=1 Tax=Nocardiopsis coralli TaxID=2772213 RepID=A0ABR9P204_9ACTN|nr:hypothetical protein [Nocardiopsis coralli]MBE2997872.1 hypothetical protein [Nocardiopsis coralli]